MLSPLESIYLFEIDVTSKCYFRNTLFNIVITKKVPNELVLMWFDYAVIGNHECLSTSATVLTNRLKKYSMVEEWFITSEYNILKTQVLHPISVNEWCKQFF